MTQPIVEIKNLSKTIKGKQIIKNVNLSFYPGKITGFIGPNGAGKTTTIRMMTGLMHPTSGEVIIDGQDLSKNFEEAISKVGVIVENPEMYKTLSGYKNLLHFARMHKGITKERIDEVIHQVGLEKRIHEKVKTYSLGMRQRLGLAQALLHKPKFLILDEPTNGLDPAGIRELRQYLRSIAETENVAIMISSHLLSEVELIVDNVAVIKNGQIIDSFEINNVQTSTYYIEVAQKDKFSSMENIKIVSAEKDGFIVEIDKENVPTLIRQLVQQEIDIFTIQPAQKTLEDQFLEMTGGGAIDEIR